MKQVVILITRYSVVWQNKSLRDFEVLFVKTKSHPTWTLGLVEGRKP